MTSIWMWIGPESFRFSISCFTAKRVAAHSGRDLFGYDGYGDFELTMSKPGAQAPPGSTAYVDVRYQVDGTGVSGQVSAETLVTPGTFPPYSVPTLTEPCKFSGVP